jgi:hypothetical protein
MTLLKSAVILWVVFDCFLMRDSIKRGSTGEFIAGLILLAIGAGLYWLWYGWLEKLVPCPCERERQMQCPCGPIRSAVTEPPHTSTQKEGRMSLWARRIVGMFVTLAAASAVLAITTVADFFE